MTESERAHTIAHDKLMKLRKKAQQVEVTATVGKSGLTDNLIEELFEQLKKNHLVKIKMLRSARYEHPRKELAALLAQRTHAVLVEVRGNTAVLYR